MSFIWNFLGRCFQRQYQLKNDCPLEQQKNATKKLEPSTVLFCNTQDNSTCLIRSKTNSGNACCDASLTPLSSSGRLRNWELDPSTVFSQSFDHFEMFGPLYDHLIAPSSLPNHTASELYAQNEEEQVTMNTNAACNLEKLVQRLETATLRLEALGAQKPTLAPKPTKNSTPPPIIPCKPIHTVSITIREDQNLCNRKSKSSDLKTAIIVVSVLTLLIGNRTGEGYTEACPDISRATHVSLKSLFVNCIFSRRQMSGRNEVNEITQMKIVTLVLVPIRT
uniref:Uncharacterized protein n=1 Tax=Elaeophora elaphi TaxID=1147741 RepID=A0A158Q7P5_9BILA